jgi:hypothetical protein
MDSTTVIPHRGLVLRMHMKWLLIIIVYTLLLQGLVTFPYKYEVAFHTTP